MSVYNNSVVECVEKRLVMKKIISSRVVGGVWVVGAVVGGGGWVWGVVGGVGGWGGGGGGRGGGESGRKKEKE